MNFKLAVSRLLKPDLIVSIIFFILGLVNYIVFGLEGGRYPPRGAILRFEGFSYFIPTGLPLLILSLILLIRFIVLSYKCELVYSAGENDNNTLSFENTPLLAFMKTTYSFDSKHLNAITISAIPNRGQIIFFAVMSLYFDFTFKNGSGNLFLPNLSGLPITGVTLLSSGLIAFGCCIFLLIQSKQIRITFITQEIDYCLDISSRLFMSQKESIISFLENIPCQKRELFYFEPLISKKRTTDLQEKMLVIIASAFLGIGFVNIFLIQYPFVILGDTISWLMFYIGSFVIIELSNRTPLESLVFKEIWNQYGYNNRYIRYLFYILIGWCGLVIIRVIVSLFGNSSIMRIILSLSTHLAILLISLYVLRILSKNVRK